MEKVWIDLYNAAYKVLKPRKVSDKIEAGSVAAALETSLGNIYVGICVDTACSLGICAERNAIFNMLTNNEDNIRRLIAIDSNGNAIPPCGACRELLSQLMPKHYKEIEIMMDYANNRVLKLKDLTPEWWL